MRAFRRRAVACAAVATTGAVLLATASAAQAQIPESVGDGIPTGQMGVQMFNYGGFISNGTNPAPITIDRAECLSTAPQASRQSDDCRWYHRSSIRPASRAGSSSAG